MVMPAGQWKDQMAIDVIPILADGIKWLAYLPKNAYSGTSAFLRTGYPNRQSFSTYRWQTDLRAGWLPIFTPQTNTVLHVGFNYRYGKVADGQIQHTLQTRSKPCTLFYCYRKFPI
jgi:phosphate-selective porin OprO/OprP